MKTFIIANAPDFDLEPFRIHLTQADLVIAADGGGNALYAAGMTPHFVIGDHDSLMPAAAEAFAAAGVALVRYPTAKDETDLELALLAAVERGAQQIDILGAFGGRWDQTLANVSLLAMPELRERQVRLLAAEQEAYLAHSATPIAGALNDIVSLLPLAGSARGITTHGLRYPLHNAELHFERSRGISNQICDLPAHVAVAEGILLVVHQGIIT
ncbi:MAG: thiamine diphosphokinase [Candidatus Viridilinea halotolerans]|uniref:Thiamine diphosphokinase n=1 Tax=Candidatus Viridilinea halotolerans TaxID=2491704 RepID=A0A426U7E1_9CHLR|nr:MAG: thiamine diphosphokinase [Candidatus Viridilinea halotolerans]